MSARYTIGRHLEDFVAEQVKSGRYSDPSDVVCAGLRLIEARDVQVTALRREIDQALAEGGAFSADEVLHFVDDRLNGVR